MLKIVAIVVLSYLGLQWWNTHNNPITNEITGESLLSIFIVFGIVIVVLIGVFKLFFPKIGGGK